MYNFKISKNKFVNLKQIYHQIRYVEKKENPPCLCPSVEVKRLTLEIDSVLKGYFKLIPLYLGFN